MREGTPYENAHFVVEFADVGCLEQCPWKRLGFWTRQQAEEFWPQLQTWIELEQPSGFFRMVPIR